MKLAKDILLADDECNTILVAGGYRNCDFIDFTDSGVSFMFNLGAGGGALILKKGYEKNQLLGTHIMSDGSVVHTCGSKVGGIVEPVTAENVSEFGMLRLMDSPKMKGMLNSTSMPNWYHCIDEALRKSGMTRKDIGYLDILHIKRSGHKAMLADLGLTEDQTISRGLRPHRPGRPDTLPQARARAGQGQGRHRHFHDSRRHRLHLGGQRHQMGLIICLRHFSPPFAARS